MLLSGLDSFVQLITALLIFAFVLVLTYFTTKFTAGLQKEKMRSPNVEVVICQTVDTKFAYSDHNPVKIEFILK